MGAATLKINGTDLSGSDYNVTVLSDVTLPPEQNNQTDFVTVPYGGRFAGREYAEAGEISAPIIVSGSTRDELLARLDNIDALFASISGDFTVSFPNTAWEDRQWKCRLQTMSAPTMVGLNAIEREIVFALTQYEAESVEVITQDVSAPLTTFSVPASGVVGGSAIAYPIYTFTASDGVSAFQIDNDTRNEGIYYGGSLAAGYKVKLDSRPNQQAALKSTDGGTTWVGVMGNLTGSNPVFPALTPGVANEFTITNGTNLSLSIEYRLRYAAR